MKRKIKKFSSGKEVFNSAYIKLAKQIDDYYEQLNKDDKEKYDEYKRIIEVTELYYDEVMNGGLYQYFANSSRIDAPKLSECLKEVNAKKHKRHFDNFIKKNKIDVNELSSFIAADVDEYLEKCKNYPFEEFNIKFYEIDDCESLNDLINEYARKSFSKIFPEFVESLDIEKLGIDEFVKRYDELATGFPGYLSSDDLVLKTVLKFRTKRIFELNNRLKLNDEFAHVVINKLMKSKNIGTLGEISVLAICIGYKTNIALENLKLIVSSINTTSYLSRINFVLRQQAGVTIVKKR